MGYRSVEYVEDAEDVLSSATASSSSSDQIALITREIWHHILELLLFLFIVLASFTVLILIARLSKKKQLPNAVSLRSKVERYLAYSRVGEILEISQALISLISVCFFVYGTYIPGNSAPIWYYSFELLFCIYFTFLWGLEYFLSKNKLRYIYSFFSFIDLVTVLPIYDDLVRGIFFTKELYTFQFLRVLRVMRILRVIRILHIFSSEITRYFFKAFITIFTFILVVAGFYMNIERNTVDIAEPPLKFHETVYFLVVTLTTVGYGDIHPTSAIGMITVTLVICIGAVLIPYQISVLTEKMGSYSKYNRDLSSSGITGHVLCCGHIDYSSLLDFLLEFYHEKYGRLKKEVVVLSVDPPSTELLTLLNHPFYKRRVKFLVGDILVDKALMRTRFQKAEGCFIFRPKAWLTGDSDSVLASVVLKNSRKSMLVYPQIITPHSTFRIPPNIKKYICLERFRSALLVQSIMCPGYSTLLSNLFTTRDSIPNGDQWVNEYAYGAINAINKFTIPGGLQGHTLSTAILQVYETMSALIIGIEEVSADRKHVRVNLHPSPSTILRDTMAFIVISRSPNAIAQYIHSTTSTPSYLIPPEIEEDSGPSALNMWYNRLFVPDAEDLVPTRDNDSLFQVGAHPLTSSFVERVTGIPRVQSSGFFEYDSSNVNPDPWMLSTPDVYSGPKLRRPDRLPSLPRVDSSSSDDLEIMESSSNALKPQHTILRSICNTDFGGDWKAMLRGLIETLEKKDTESLDVAVILRGLKPLLFPPLAEEVEASFVPKKGHILILGSMVGLEDFLKCFRISNNTPIVILHPTIPHESVWQLSLTMPFISFVKGTPFDRRDLEKCNIHHASKIMILSNPYEGKESDAAMDADSLLAYFDVRNTTHATQILVEFVNESNLRFMQKFGVTTKVTTYIKSDKKEAFRKPTYYLTPEYAAGHVATHSVVDSMMCQIYYKNYLNLIANELIYGLNNLESVMKDDTKPRPTDDAFTVPKRPMFCYHLPIPPSLESRTYLELLRHFLAKDILPIGLFRSKEMNHSPLPYVYTCPPDNTILHPLDKAIVFSLLPPK